MNKHEVRKEWLEALRSKEYKQGKGYLRTRDKNQRKDRFCCLGILCDLAVKHGVILGVEEDLSDKGRKVYNYLGSTGVLPDEVTEWVGLSDNTGSLELDGEETDLALLNDNGTSFEKIANIIESEAVGLFY